MKFGSLIFLGLCFASTLVFSQDKKMSSEGRLLAKNYSEAPFDKRNYDSYFEYLLQQQLLDDADSLIVDFSKIRGNDPTLKVDLAKILIERKQVKQAQQILTQIPNEVGNDMYVFQQLVGRLTKFEMYEPAVQLTTTFRKNMPDNVDINRTLIQLYSNLGYTSERLEQIIAIQRMSPFLKESIQNTLLSWEQKDSSIYEKVSKGIHKKVEKSTAGYYAADLYLWWRLQKEKGSPKLFEEVIKMDNILSADGSIVNAYFNNALANEQQDWIDMTMNYVDKDPNKHFVYQQMYRNYLQYTFRQIKASTKNPVEKVQQYVYRYHKIMSSNLQDEDLEYVLQYAHLQAWHLNRIDTAIELLKSVIKEEDKNPQNGALKIELGDIYILKNQLWEASLEYAQVDKLFRQAVIGETARFKMAMTFFYKGDFEYATHLLEVLKRATTDYIANDALETALLITENTQTDEQSEILKSYAQANLLSFQHKYEEALVLLDKLYIKDETADLNDDIQLKKAAIYQSIDRTEEALKCLDDIIDNYKEGVLADNALFMKGNILLKLQQKAAAETVFMKLLTDYPGSIYVSYARSQLTNL